MTALSTERSPSQRIAAEVRAELARQGISQRRFALIMGVNYMWVNRRISVSADKELTFEDVDKMAQALGVSSQRLIAASQWLPRLDSNQQPSGYRSALVTRRVVTAVAA